MGLRNHKGKIYATTKTIFCAGKGVKKALEPGENAPMLIKWH